MPRKPLTKDQKARMQSARKLTTQEREAALTALETNVQQFTHPKFWARVAPECQDEIMKAIRKAQRSEKKAEIGRLRKKIQELDADV